MWKYRPNIAQKRVCSGLILVADFLDIRHPWGSQPFLVMDLHWIFGMISPAPSKKERKRLQSIFIKKKKVKINIKCNFACVLQLSINLLNNWLIIFYIFYRIFFINLKHLIYESKYIDMLHILLSSLFREQPLSTNLNPNEPIKNHLFIIY